MLQQTDDDNLLRDIHSKALVSTDTAGLEAAKKRKAAVSRDKEEKKNLIERVSDLEGMVDGLGKLVTTLNSNIEKLIKEKGNG